MFEVNQLCGQMHIGKQGENLARIVYFDEPSTWEKDFGEGRCELLHQRNGDSAPYPVKLEMVDGRYCWKITAADTAIVGDGKCELRYIVNDVVIKSKIWTTTVLEALGDASEEAPEPQKAWVDQVLEAADKVEDAVVHCPIIGENGNWLVYDFNVGGYVDTGISASGEVLTEEQLANIDAVPDKADKKDLPTKVSQLTNDKEFVTQNYVDNLVGDIDVALDNILAIQNSLISQNVNLAKDGD